MHTFRDSPFMNAAEKRRALTQWCRFLQALARHFGDKGRCFRAFGDALYTHLIQHCSFIAHFNRSGFFQEYFDHGDDAIRFLLQFDRGENPEGTSVEYGDASWLQGENADVNQAMRETATPFLRSIRASAAAAQETADLTEARRLAARHGLSLFVR